MGYYTSLYGELTIDPPAPWSKLRGTPLTEFGDGLLRVRIEEVTEETDEGFRTIKRGTVVEPWSGDAKAYKIEAELQAIVDALPDHRFEGEITGRGEDVGDYWRLFVNADRKVIKEKARLVWPDGSTVEGV